MNICGKSPCQSLPINSRVDISIPLGCFLELLGSLLSASHLNAELKGPVVRSSVEGGVDATERNSAAGKMVYKKIVQLLPGTAVPERPKLFEIFSYVFVCNLKGI